MLPVELEKHHQYKHTKHQYYHTWSSMQRTRYPSVDIVIALLFYLHTLACDCVYVFVCVWLYRIDSSTRKANITTSKPLESKNSFIRIYSHFHSLRFSPYHLGLMLVAFLLACSFAHAKSIQKSKMSPNRWFLRFYARCIKNTPQSSSWPDLSSEMGENVEIGHNKTIKLVLIDNWMNDRETSIILWLCLRV